MRNFINRNIILTGFLIASASLNSFAQMSKSDVMEILSLEEYNGVANVNAEDIDYIYDKYIQSVSFKTDDLLTGLGNSALSGISLGAEESQEYQFKHSGWLPEFIQNWYNSPQYKSGSPLYQLVSWREVWHEVDYAADRAAYESLKLYFGGKWYLAYIVHWLVKNTFATFIRDKFLYDNYLYSFKLNLVFNISK